MKFETENMITMVSYRWCWDCGEDLKEGMVTSLDCDCHLIKDADVLKQKQSKSDGMVILYDWGCENLKKGLVCLCSKKCCTNGNRYHVCSDEHSDGYKDYESAERQFYKLLG